MFILEVKAKGAYPQWTRTSWGPYHNGLFDTPTEAETKRCRLTREYGWCEAVYRIVKEGEDAQTTDKTSQSGS